MSGYKHATITISEEEYRRLHSADMKRRFTEFANINAQNSQQLIDLQDILQEMDQRQRQLEENMSVVNQDSSQADVECLQEIVMQNSFYHDNLAASFEQSTADIYSTISSVSDRFAHELQQDREIYLQNIQVLMLRQESLFQQEESKQSSSTYWLAQCEILAEFIQQQYDHERFFPGRYNHILRNLNFAIANLNEGFFEASLQGTQQVYLELSDFHFELETTICQWQIEYEKTYFAIRQLIADLDLNAKVDALGLEGESLNREVNLDYWTKGKYSLLLNHIRELLEYFIQDQNCLALQDLDRIYNQILPTIRSHFEALIYEARLEALNSQLRMNIAEKALQALETHGFKLGDSGYTDRDMRSPFYAHLESFDGSQVDIQVIPTDNASQELSNELFVRTRHPQLKTEHEARLYWDELYQALVQHNLRVNHPEVLSASPSTLAPQALDQQKTNLIQNQREI